MGVPPFLAAELPSEAGRRKPPARSREPQPLQTRKPYPENRIKGKKGGPDKGQHPLARCRKLTQTVECVG